MARNAPNDLQPVTVLPLQTVDTLGDQQRIISENINYVGRHLTPMVVCQSLHEKHTDADFWFIRETAASTTLKRTWRIPASQYSWSPDKLRVHLWARSDPGGNGGIATVGVSTPGASRPISIVPGAAWTLYTGDITLPTPTNDYYDLSLYLESNDGDSVDVTSIAAYYLPASTTTPDAEDNGVVYLDNDREAADEPMAVARQHRKVNNLETLLTTRLGVLVAYAADETWTTNADGPFALGSSPPPNAPDPTVERVVNSMPIRIGPKVNQLRIWVRGYRDTLSAAPFAVRVWTARTGYEGRAELSSGAGSGAFAWQTITLPMPAVDEVGIDYLFVELGRASGTIFLRGLSVWEEVV